MLQSTGVKFVDITGQYGDICEKLVDAIRKIVEQGAFVGGPAVEHFEEKLAQYAGVRFAIGVSDGTAALKLALLAAGLRPGDRVIVPANSFIASANAVVHAGGIPEFVDCDPHTYLVDLNHAESAFKETGARFILPVHLYGNPCDMNEVRNLAGRYGSEVIEDNAQALGATFQGRRTGSFGAATGVSFYPAKNLGAFGQGGAVLTDDEEIAQRVRMFAEQGQGGTRYYHDVIGYNDRLHSIQACVLNHLLDKLDAFNSARAEAARVYEECLPSKQLQRTTVGAKHVYHLLEYRCHSEQDRERLAAWLRNRKIGCGFHYPVPIHKQTAYANFNDLTLPVAESLARTLISLPMHPLLCRREIEFVCEHVRLGVEETYAA